MSTKVLRPLHTFSPRGIPAMTIREASATDRRALVRLAQRDTSPVPGGRLLIAEVDGEVRAAIEVDSGRAIADPFRPTAELVDLLRRRAAQIRDARRRPLRILARTPAPPRGGRAELRERAA
jgi:hypothetical protein